MAVMPCRCGCDPNADAKDAHAGHEQEAAEAPPMHPEGHLVTLVTKALIPPKKEYTQPTVNMGENLYFYKVIYVATVKDKTLTLRKTVAREDADARQEEPVEPAMLQNITAAAGGTLMEASVMLP